MNYFKTHNDFLTELRKSGNEKLRELYNKVLIERYRNHEPYYRINKKIVRWVLIALWFGGMVAVGVLLGWLTL